MTKPAVLPFKTTESESCTTDNGKENNGLTNHIDAGSSEQITGGKFTLSFSRHRNNQVFNLYKPCIVVRDVGEPTMTQGLYTQQKRNAPLRTVQLPGRSQVIDQFSLYLCKGMSGTAASHVFCNLAS